MPQSENIYKVNADVPLKIKNFLVSYAIKSPFTSLSSFLAHHFTDYLKNNNTWSIPESNSLLYDSFGEISTNNISFYIDVSLKDQLTLINKRFMRRNKGTAKHFLYCMYYKLSNQ